VLATGDGDAQQAERRANEESTARIHEGISDERSRSRIEIGRAGFRRRAAAGAHEAAEDATPGEARQGWPGGRARASTAEA